MSDEKARPKQSARPDGRKKLVVYLEPELIKNLKKAALDEDRNAYEIAEEAVRDWLTTYKASGAREKRRRRPKL